MNKDCSSKKVGNNLPAHQQGVGLNKSWSDTGNDSFQSPLKLICMCWHGNNVQSKLWKERSWVTKECTWWDAIFIKNNLDLFCSISISNQAILQHPNLRPIDSSVIPNTPVRLISPFLLENCSSFARFPVHLRIPSSRALSWSALLSSVTVPIALGWSYSPGLLSSSLVRTWIQFGGSRARPLVCAVCVFLNFNFILGYSFFYVCVWSHFCAVIFFFNFYLFIYLFLAVLGLRFCARAFSSCGKWGPLFIAVRGPLIIAASLVAEHRLQTRRLSSCGSRA